MRGWEGLRNNYDFLLHYYSKYIIFCLVQIYVDNIKYFDTVAVTSYNRIKKQRQTYYTIYTNITQIILGLPSIWSKCIITIRQHNYINVILDLLWVSWLSFYVLCDVYELYVDCDASCLSYLYYHLYLDTRRRQS